MIIYKKNIVNNVYMTTRKYVFVSSSNEPQYNPRPVKNTKFYQICAFPNPNTGKFEVRENIVNGDNIVISYRTVSMSEKYQKKLLRELRDNKYKLYSTRTLDSIDLPSVNDMFVARSNMLNDDSAYSGFAPFENDKDFNWRGSIP